MANIYDDLRQVAVDVFGEFKQGDVHYVSLTASVGARPDRPNEPVETITPVNATVKPVSTKYVDGTHIIQSDVEISFANTGLIPSLTGFFTVDGARFKIIEVMKRPAAGNPVSFTVIARG
jgi:hypothetical protein